ncbi:hypothetical protein JG688_00002429 [Phytophthora aleatoria]|uniref:Uncharacterized protein n=1 Tax=Phytophthora aleatoria TaxID=2496075 RepID=A0A8J5IUN5_9STRA|nr:hypothetical protein JG688_00002429 [Phytophthora aleatoria]
MVFKISLALGFQEHHEQLHKSPSILAREEYLDNDDEWDEHVKPRRRSSSVGVALNSCFTSLSPSLGAVTTRAKKLYSRDSSRPGRRLRHSMIEIPSAQADRLRTRANSMPAPYRSSESDLDLFGGVEGQIRDEDSTGGCLPKIEPQ